MPGHRSIAFLLSLSCASLAEAQICQQGWSDEFGAPPIGAYARALAVFDPDGPGPMPASLYIGGYALSGQHMLRWDGSQLTPFGPGFHPTSSYEPAVQSVVVHDDDGPGPMLPALYVAGAFDRVGTLACQGLARWDGVAWSVISPPDSSMGPWHIWTLDPDGSGAESLYASAGDNYAIASDLWQRTGATWTRVGTNHVLPFSINSIAAFDADGAGPVLYATGSSQDSTALARLNGATWTTIATGSPVSYGSPRFGPLAVLDADGPGGDPPVLVMGGRIDRIGSVQVHSLAQFDGQTWSSFQGGVSSGYFYPADVLSLAVLGDEPDGGPALYAGGYFSTAGSVSAQGIARFAAGQWWSPQVGINGRVSTIGAAPTTPQTGQNSGVFIGGDFWYADNVPAYGLTGFTRLGWAPLGQGLNNDVQSAVAWSDPALGPGLYVGGGMTIASGRPAVGIARYDGHTWKDLAVGTNDRVTALTTFRGNLIAGGLFTTAGGVPAQHIASWNGSEWSPLGFGLNGPVRALAVLDSVQGPMLYAGGEFDSAGGAAARNIARWDGAAWSALDTGINGRVNAMTVWRQPQGDALIVGGSFTSAGHFVARNIARWDGAQWSALTNDGPSLVGEVFALSMHDEGTGPELFAGGRFTIPGDGGWGNIAQFDTDRWLPLRSGVSGTVSAMASWTNGSARDSVLFVGGAFQAAAWNSPRNAARWVYHTWRPMGGDLDGPVAAIGLLDSSVFLGGSFRNASWHTSPRIARWTQCPPCYVNCDGSNGRYGLNTADFTCFLNLFMERSLYANCDGSTAPPVLDVNDFVCFLNRFAVGCP